ncbi:MAG: HAMP domain-containing histidine kinase [Actinobacteria bacterium]|nr:HAMP domain-containing histidine kinase [Actinomycetota bacterium]
MGDGANGSASGRSRLVVANGGPAVDPAEVEALFEPFRRGTAERTGSVAGAGLGLSIVRSVATAHGGTATATGRPEGGLEVTVELPADDA